MDHNEFLGVVHKLPSKAVQLTIHNMESLSKYLRGDIKGTRLPIEQREIEWYNKHRDMEQRAKVGEVIIMYFNELGKVVEIDVYSQDYFKVMFDEEGPHENTVN